MTTYQIDKPKKFCLNCFETERNCSVYANQFPFKKTDTGFVALTHIEKLRRRDEVSKTRSLPYVENTKIIKNCFMPSELLFVW